MSTYIHDQQVITGNAVQTAVVTYDAPRNQYCLQVYRGGKWVKSVSTAVGVFWFLEYVFTYIGEHAYRKCHRHVFN